MTEQFARSGEKMTEKFSRSGEKSSTGSARGYKRTAFWMIPLILLVCALVAGYIFIDRAIDSVNDIPDLLESGSKWICTSNVSDFDAEFEVGNNGGMEGTMTVNGETSVFCIRYREGYAEFYDCSAKDACDSDYSDHLFFTSGIRAKNGELIFYIEDDLRNIGIKELRFERQ